MNTLRFYSLLFILVLGTSCLLSQSTSYEQVYTKIKDSFAQNNFIALENLLPGNRKIFFFITPIIPKNGYFTSQQLHFILQDMQKEIKTLSFAYEDKEQISGDKISKKAIWKLSKNGENFTVNIFIYLENIDNEWKIVQIKIS